jgi:hypothetical protein
LSCKPKKENSAVQITSDSLKISVDFFNAKFNSSNTTAGSFFQGYSMTNNEFMLFDLKNRTETARFKSPISLRDTAIGRIIQFYIHNTDSIFLLTENKVLLVDTSGKIKFNIDVSEPLKDLDDGEVFVFDYSNFFPIYFDSQKRELLMHVMCNCDLIDPEYFTKRLEIKVSLDKKEVTFLNYSFPSRYREQSYGQSVFPFRIVNNEYSIVSFQSDDSLYVFNRNTNGLKKYYGRSEFQKSDFIPFDTSYNGDIERYKEHVTVNPTYERIIYDKYKNQYYRFLLKELPLKGEDGVYSNLLDKDLVIMVFDKDFNIIKEDNVGPTYLWYYAFVTPQGLYIQKKEKYLPKNSSTEYAYFSVFNWN